MHHTLNQKGFSLISTIVTFGLIGILSASMAGIMKTTNISIKLSSQSANYQTQIYLAKLALQNESIMDCNLEVNNLQNVSNPDDIQQEERDDPAPWSNDPFTFAITAGVPDPNQKFELAHLEIFDDPATDCSNPVLGYLLQTGNDRLSNWVETITVDNFTLVSTNFYKARMRIVGRHIKNIKEQDPIKRYGSLMTNEFMIYFSTTSVAVTASFKDSGGIDLAGKQLCPGTLAFVDNGAKGFCISGDEQGPDLWKNAMLDCYNQNAYLCKPEEWFQACKKEDGAILQNFKNLNHEWTGELAGTGDATIMGIESSVFISDAGCTNDFADQGQSLISNPLPGHVYRCCQSSNL